METVKEKEAAINSQEFEKAAEFKAKRYIKELEDLKSQWVKIKNRKMVVMKMWQSFIQLDWDSVNKLHQRKQAFTSYGRYSSSAGNRTGRSG